MKIERLRVKIERELKFCLNSKIKLLGLELVSRGSGLQFEKRKMQTAFGLIDLVEENAKDFKRLERDPTS